MAKHVSIDDNLESFFNTVEDVRQSIRTTNATYHSELEPISSAVSSFSFGSWSDDVQKKLEECVNTTLGTNGVYAIEDDFSDGGFKQLMDCMDQLYNDSYMANENKKEYVRLKNKRDSEPETVDGKDNPNRPSADAVQRAKNNTQEVINSINSTLNTISQIVFGGTVSSGSNTSQESAAEEQSAPSASEIVQGMQQGDSYYVTDSSGTKWVLVYDRGHYKVHPLSTGRVQWHTDNASEVLQRYTLGDAVPKSGM